MIMGLKNKALNYDGVMGKVLTETQVLLTSVVATQKVQPVANACCNDSFVSCHIPCRYC